jgi:peptidoglycan/xylan/chitin deacetylase (PgdA/CDA1 family)
MRLALRACVAPKIRITFDDGNMSDATIAMPELVKRDLTATFFVCSGRVGTPHYLDRSAISDLLDSGMQIGSHGMHHRDWRTLTADTLDEEASTARRQLEDMCGGPVTRAAIPFGSYDRRVLARLRKEDFKTVYTSDMGLARPDAWLKPRNSVPARMSRKDLNGLLTAAPSVRAGLRRKVVMLYKGLR